ncbi:hypothetical protein [Pararhodonellum marinum]|uniref:hypothetical protein n=1 Tax=Pararhodonellum marinum TaxID=2755358 RepID=UPI00188E2246|nr:hypothetical protein [Pararhodonellum marinum]
MIRSFTFLAVLFIQTTLFAQAPERTRSQGVFVELLGNGLLYSFNYDTRFNQSYTGLGGRVGLSYLAVDGTNLTTVPVVLNYLLGKDKHLFEVGIGTTFVAAADRTNVGPISEANRGSTFIGTMSLGYRLEPRDGGFMFRAGITPIFDSSNFFPFWPQVSFGYAF